MPGFSTNPPEQKTRDGTHLFLPYPPNFPPNICGFVVPSNSQSICHKNPDAKGIERGRDRLSANHANQRESGKLARIRVIRGSFWLSDETAQIHRISIKLKHFCSLLPVFSEKP